MRQTQVSIWFEYNRFLFIEELTMSGRYEYSDAGFPPKCLQTFSERLQTFYVAVDYAIY